MLLLLAVLDLLNDYYCSFLHHYLSYGHIGAPEIITAH